jgi:mRNA interferase MazF
VTSGTSGYAAHRGTAEEIPGIKRGEIWWASLPGPAGSAPGFRRPVLIVQSDEFNSSRIGTVIAVAITSNTHFAEAPGKVLLSRGESGLPRPSVANVSQLITLDRRFLAEKVRTLSYRTTARIETGLSLVLGL